jgi:transcriptional regulator GlxA family with amidase domain
MVQLFLDDLASNVMILAHPWTSRSMAEHCGLGVTQFVHYCRQLTNMAPIQYLNQSRVEMASQMLVNAPQRSITDIALACGFGSSQSNTRGGAARCPWRCRAELGSGRLCRYA